MRIVRLFVLCAGVAAAQPRTVQSIVPWLTGNASCWSAVELQNLGSRPVTADVEAHRPSGALVPLEGRPGMQIVLKPGERGSWKLHLAEETAGAWVRVREVVPAPNLSPVIAVSGATECLDGNELRSTSRDIAWPMRNPWYSGDVKDGDDGVIALINTSERPADVWVCYSFGVLYSVPRPDRPPELTPVCSETIREQVPPFGSRQWPVVHNGNSQFALHSHGDAIVLQMLRPANTSRKVYKVDATIKFGEEVAP